MRPVPVASAVESPMTRIRTGRDGSGSASRTGAAAGVEAIVVLGEVVVVGEVVIVGEIADVAVAVCGRRESRSSPQPCRP
jgi:hypothetical protein